MFISEKTLLLLSSFKMYNAIKLCRHHNNDVNEMFEFIDGCCTIIYTFSGADEEEPDGDL